MRLPGFVLIIIGIVLLMSLWLLSEYQFNSSYKDTILVKEIILDEESFLGDLRILHGGEEIVVPCKYVFIAGTLTILLGILAIVFHHDPRAKR